MARKKLDLGNIQGNILGGFNKGFQTFVFLHFTDAQKGRAWIKKIANQISPTSMVLRFNQLFKALRATAASDPRLVVPRAGSTPHSICSHVPQGVPRRDGRAQNSHW